MAHLYVIAGHGAGDPGACAFGYNEAERVRALAQRIKDLGGDDVTLGDFSRNYYEDGGLNYLDIPSDWQVVELHMDSASPSARGGHVIIYGGYDPDEYDLGLAELMRSFFPGRSNVLVGRNDLANVNRAANRGISYRLIENGFISNGDDLNKFNWQIDDLARGYLSVFNINYTKNEPVVEVEPEPEIVPPTPAPADKEEQHLDVCPTCGQVIVKKLSTKDKAVETMLHLVTHDSHGYTQGNRWGNGKYEWITLSDGTQVQLARGDRDCSSAVVSAWEAVDPGCMGGATYTGNYYDCLMSTGKWKYHPWEEDYELSYADIVINFSVHVEMCVDDNYTLAGFNISENGTIYGMAGDQTGYESYVKPFYNPSYGWDGIFEYIGDEVVEDEPIVEEEEVASLDPVIVELQQLLNVRLGSFGIEGVTVTGNYDLNTQLGLIKLYQASCNVDYNAGLDVDGWYGPASQAVTSAHPIGEGYEIYGNDVWVAKAGLVGQGHTLDLASWVWEGECESACMTHQGYHGIEQDGICGPITFGTLFPLVFV